MYLVRPLPLLWSESEDLAFDEDDPGLATTEPERSAVRPASGVAAFLAGIADELEHEADCVLSSVPPAPARRRA